MSKIYVEVSDGVVQNIYTDSKEEIDVVICDHDNEAEEKEGDDFDQQASKACEELNDKRRKLKRIF